MANITFLEAGGASTDGVHLYFPGGYSTGSIDKDIKPSGAYSSLLLGSQQRLVTPACLDSSNRISLYWRRTDEFTSIDLLSFNFNEDNEFLWLVGRSDGLLEWEPNSGPRTTGTHYMQINTFHRIAVAYNFNGANNLSVKVYLDGVLDISATGQLTNGRTRANNLGISGSSFGQQNHIRIAHLYIDDGADLSDPGNVHCTAKRPAGIYNGNWATHGGSSAVDERPLNETNYIADLTGVAARQDYYLQNRNAGDVDLTDKSLLGYMGWIWAKQDVVGGSPKLLLNGWDNVYDVSLTTSPAARFKTITSPDYPSDSDGIGMLSATSGFSTYLYECGVVVAYLAGEETSPRKVNQQMFNMWS